MSTAILTNTTNHQATSGWLGMAYAVSGYTIGMAGLFWVLLAVGGLAPYGLTSWQVGNPAAALLINVLLVVIFATQHTIMARKPFKKALTRVLPQHLERATFVIASGIAMTALVWFWQTVPGVVWETTTLWAVITLRTLYVIGIAYLVGSSFVTNHFELFGLRQAWLNLRGHAYEPVTFKQNWTYRYSRHPMMLGLLLAFWCTPEMSATRFVMAALLTLYIFIGIRFEERTLVQEFGETYRKYREEIGLFFTLKH
jgi:protein-S-isoprenylcysteine O-methyltransferase Ste14